MITLQGNTATYCGESTDDKPTDAAVNAKFLELDTGDKYYFDGSTWEKIGGSTT